jgi:hypothetical protein
MEEELTLDVLIESFNAHAPQLAKSLREKPDAILISLRSMYHDYSQIFRNGSALEPGPMGWHRLSEVDAWELVLRNLTRRLHEAWLAVRHDSPTFDRFPVEIIEELYLASLKSSPRAGSDASEVGAVLTKLKTAIDRLELRAAVERNPAAGSGAAEINEPSQPPKLPTSSPTLNAEKTVRARKKSMGAKKVTEHWMMVMGSGDRDLIELYLTEAEVPLAKRIGTSRNTLRKVEAFKERTATLITFRRANG